MVKIYGKTVCEKIKESIADEASAHPMYKDLLKHMLEENQLSRKDREMIEKIIDDEMKHESFFRKLADKTGCIISTRIQEPKLYSDLPKEERISLAKKLRDKLYKEE